jgi:hypothetical protein
MKTITIKQWDSAGIEQRDRWLSDEDVMLDEQGYKILCDRTDKLKNPEEDQDK